MAAKSELDAVIAKRVKIAMAARKLTIRELSQATSIPYRTLRNYLKGINSFPASAVVSLAEALDVSADFLLFGIGARFDIRPLTNGMRVAKQFFYYIGSEISLEALARAASDTYNTSYREPFVVDRSEVDKIDAELFPDPSISAPTVTAQAVVPIPAVSQSEPKK